MCGQDSNVQFTPDGKTVLVNAGPLGICDLDTGTVRQIELWTHRHHGCMCAITPDGAHFVATQYNYGTPQGWITCRPIATPDAGHALWSRELSRPINGRPAFLTDDRFLVRVNPPWNDMQGHKLPPRWAVCSTTTGDVLFEWESRELNVGNLAASPDRGLIAGIRTIRLTILSAADLTKPLATLKNNVQRDFTDLAFHPSGRYLAVTSNDETVKLYDTATWQIARTFTWKIGRMRSIAFSPDGALAAAGSDSGKVVVWDVDV
jgi:WD40 repeat protein